MAKIPGSWWVEGEQFHFIDSNNVEWYYTGEDVKAADVGAKICPWIDGNNFCYVSETGRVRRILQTINEGIKDGLSGSVWIEAGLLHWLDQTTHIKRHAHTDVAESYADVPHVDAEHGDIPHADSHTDTHNDVSHTDTHSDVPHSDSHTNSHSDVAHIDHYTNATAEGYWDAASPWEGRHYHNIAHSDTHSDTAHTDTHTDNHTNEHDDGGDPYGDIYFDSYDNIPHGDVTHIDSHSDTPHTDNTHYDYYENTPHTNSHSDVPHSDVVHTDTHSDVVHTNTHSDVPHADSHTDVAHVDSHTDATAPHADEPVHVDEA